MKHCPNPACDHLRRFGRVPEYRDDFDRCADCGEALAPGEAPPEPVVAYRELVTIYTAPDRLRAHLVRSLLEAQGIDAVVQGESLSGAVGELPATVLNVRVQVAPEWADRAREIALAFDASGPAAST